MPTTILSASPDTGEGTQRPSLPCVLIVDSSEESRDVLRTVLQRRGVRIAEAAEARQGLALARQLGPSVIVLDMDTEAASDPQVQAEFASQVDRQPAYLVVLGKFPAGSWGQPCRQDRAAIAKPYHFGPLVRTIETFVAQSLASRDRADRA